MVTRAQKQSKTYQTIAIALGAVALLGVTAFAASYATRETMKPEQKTVVTRNYVPTGQMANARQPIAPVRQNCDDGNIVGTIGGAVAGGVIGSNVGSGKGKTAATIGGTLGGAYLGKEYIPTHGVTCN